jgi:hypothetical protein
MAAPEQPAAGAPRPPSSPRRQRPAVQGPRYGRYVWLLVILILILITINTLVTKPNGLAGLAPGTKLPPFAVPLATSDLQGAADVATRPHEGLAGNVPACRLRRSGVLNVCQLYEQGPVVLALFVNGSSCTGVLKEMQGLLGAFPHVRFAAVAVKNEHGEVRKLVDKQRLSFPVGYDEEGDLAALYKLATCPQVTFARRGGIVQSKALLGTPTASELRRRVEQLLASERPGT